jgi:hypothetical protein
MQERTILVRRISTGSVFRIVAAGSFLSLVPLTVFFGILSIFGLDTIKWNNHPVHGIAGLLVSPFLGMMMAAFFTAFGGISLTAGLWLYSKFRTLKLRVMAED